MKRRPIIRKSILINSIYLVISVFIISIIVNCSQSFSFSGVLDELEGGSGSSLFADIDYIVESITNSPSTADVNSSISQSFTYRNVGSEPGISDVFWTAFISDNPFLDEDIPISSGVASALSGSVSSGSYSISGNWPSSGIYYLIVNVSGGGDIDPSNNNLTSNQFTIYAPVDEIDYTVSNVSMEDSIVTSGSLCSEHFDLTNAGGTAGSNDITWTAYASTHSSLGIGTDIVIGTDNTLSGLDAYSTYVDISILGNWPGIAGVYYLIIEIEADDETITDNNTAYIGMFTVNDPPDYAITSANFLSEGVPRTILSTTASDYEFEITEINDEDGSEQVAWDVFASINTSLDGSDFPLKSGTLSAFTTGASSGAISFADINWPDFGSYYYIILSISAGDDNNLLNNTFVSPEIFVPEYYEEETENNSDIGPTLGELTNVSNLDSSLQNDKLDLNELIKVKGFKHVNNEYDTYKFIIDSSVTSVDISVEWANGLDSFDFYFWDEANNTTASIAISVSTEPAVPPLTISGLSPGRHYISVKSLGLGDVGDAYSLLIHGRP